ncbi:MAG: ankyrin repeat domain-containing protein [Candidatus Calescibacterium sp.]|nr:ankyrin repeat domain-containing protein [Candidatus Calescibacterium sp.]
MEWYRIFLELNVIEIEHMIRNGFNVNIRDAETNTTPLHVVAAAPEPKLKDALYVANLLIKNGSDVNLKDLKNRLPLHYAIIHGNYEIADLLIQNGSEINTPDKGEGYKDVGKTPLHYAVMNLEKISESQREKKEKCLNIIKLLIAKGADPYRKDDDGMIPAQNDYVKDILKEFYQKTVSYTKYIPKEIYQKTVSDKKQDNIEQKENNTEQRKESQEKEYENKQKKQYTKPEQEQPLQITNSFSKLNNQFPFGLDINYKEHKEESQIVHRLQIKFKDLLKNLEGKISELEMYEHQKIALELLKQGKNIIVKSETGSGKTEIWTSYAISQQKMYKNYGVVAIYPTKALTGDQIKRIAEYYKENNLGVEFNEKDQIYRGSLIKYDGDTSDMYIHHDISHASTILTNPEIFLDVLHKYKNGKYHKLINFFKTKLKIIVVDELDFYGSSRATVLLYLVKKALDLFDSEQRKIRLIFLGATVSNAEAIRDFFPNKDFKIIEGKSYRPENHIYIVYGKKTREAKSKSDNNSSSIHSVMKDILKQNEMLVQQIVLKCAELPETTIVFAKSRDKANTIYSKTKEHIQTSLQQANISEIPSNQKETEIVSEKIAVHHSSVPGSERIKIEKGLRDGKIRVAITVKTLMQGIDIGSVTRTIHVGLPISKNEFMQKEGRKGRRKNIQRTETVIIPISEYDLSIVEDFVTWKKYAPQESVLLNPENKILELYGKYISNPSDLIRTIKNKLDDKDIRKIPKDNFELEFYEPLKNLYRDYEVYVLKIENETVKIVEKDFTITHRELIQRHMVCCIDAIEESSIVFSTYNYNHINYKEKNSIIKVSSGLLPNRYSINQSSNYELKKLIEKLKGDGWIIHQYYIEKALKEYKRACREFGQKYDLHQDIKYSRLTSHVKTIVLFEEVGGLQLVEEIPFQIFWFLDPRVRYDLDITDQTYKTKLMKIFDFDEDQKGLKKIIKEHYTYKFFTYAYISDIDPNDIDLDEEKFDNAFDFLISILYYKYGVQKDLIKYFRYPITRALLIWENEPVGLLEKMRKLEEFNIGSKILSFESLLKDIENQSLSDNVFLIILKNFSLGYLRTVINFYIQAKDKISKPDITDSEKEKLKEKVEKIIKLLEEIRRGAKRLAYYVYNTISVKIKDKINQVPKNPRKTILIVDEILERYAIIIAGPEKPLKIIRIFDDSAKQNEYQEIIQTIDEISTKERHTEYIVYWKLSKDFVQILRENLPVMKRDRIINLSEEISKIYEGPISLGRIREEIDNRTDLIQHLNEITRMVIEKEGTDNIPTEKIRDLFVYRGETIGILFNLLNV